MYLSSKVIEILEHYVYGSPIKSSDLSRIGDGQSFIVIMNKIPNSTNVVFYFI